MRNRIFWSLAVLSSLWTLTAQGQQDGGKAAIEAEILKVLTAQAAAWNAGDIQAFMQTYWHSEQLTFSSGGETRRGWQATLERYQKSYPPEKMGRLHFDQTSVQLLAEDVALVLGDWHLDIHGKLADGNFSLVLRRIEGKWQIIHDHSSRREAAGLKETTGSPPSSEN